MPMVRCTSSGRFTRKARPVIRSCCIHPAGSPVVMSCASPEDDAVDEGSSTPGGKADELFEESPLYLTGAFDGSQRFGMWIDTLEFTRAFEREHGKPLHWTYFINTCYYDRTVSGSWIGTAQSRDEELARWALTQQALNEGHEIANHAVLHQDGSGWSADRWRT
ncbi:MAG: hypothetical protein AAF648_11030, partial [Pseudomonadota bacterium]